MNRAALLIAAAALCLATACSKAPERFQATTDGVLVHPQGGPAPVLRLRLIEDDIVRVTAWPTQDTELPESLMTLRSEGGSAPFELSSADGVVRLQGAAISAEVSLEDGHVRFFDADGQLLLSERAGGRSFAPAGIGDERYHAIRQRFESPDDEAFYGLGQHQNGQVNYKGEDVELAQHNIVAVVPFLQSSRGYGLLWDNNAITRFGDPRPYLPIDEGLVLRDADGEEGALTASYAVDGALKLRRRESRIDYASLKALESWPEGLEDPTGQTVVWEGSIEAPGDGEHRFKLYSSSDAKVWVDGELVLDRWRQNWNPWYHHFTLAMRAGQPRQLRIEWTPDGGYLGLVHRDPLPAEQRGELSLWSEAGQAIDYYVVAGRQADDLIAGYRTLTGKSTMLPKWAYGFWQSRERYKTQDEIVDALRSYREQGIPIDNIVMDWSYWPEERWGSHAFDAARFPDPQQMVDDIHAMNARIMISVWPKFYVGTEHFRELDAKGHIYRRNVEVGERDWIGEGYVSSFYDPYSEEARGIYWRQIDETLNVLGIDAWWLDATEPDVHSNLDMAERKRRMGPTAMGPAEAYFNSYSLMTTRGVYEGERRSDPGQRAFILTRSAFAGQQRHAAATWSGDVVSRWSNLREQIPAGIHFSMSGIPNWTTDIGGFALEKRYEQPNADDLAEWRELNLRWFQYGAFCPLFRSHGQFPYREIYHIAPPGHPVYESMVAYDRLRYRTMPYIYSLAVGTWRDDGTMMRGLVMDFPDDPAVRDIGDEYLWGPAFLVAPVTEYRARRREVYLPAGADWYDFHSGRRHQGGQRLMAEAPLERMPLYVRAGAIVPVGPLIQHTGEQPDAPLTFYVYTGADGAFTLYEDDGLSYDYEDGAQSAIELRYDEARGRLTVGARRGRFDGMPVQREFRVRWIEPGEAAADDFEQPADASLRYDGGEIVFER